MSTLTVEGLQDCGNLSIETELSAAELADDAALRLPQSIALTGYGLAKHRLGDLTLRSGIAAFAARSSGAATTAPPPAAVEDPGDMLFSVYVEKWYKRLDLVESTMSSYRSTIDCHLLPKFGRYPLNAIDVDLVAEWEKEEREAGNKRSSIALWRGLLSTILSDAVTADRLISFNVAARKRGRGRKTSRRRNRPASQAILSALDALLIAERMALLSGRDDEFVWEILKRYTGMRSGELHGLETKYLINTRHPLRRVVRVEWQLAEVRGKLIKSAPKDESNRDVDVPLFLWDLLTQHVSRTQPTPCSCHGATYVFTGNTRRRAAGGSAGVSRAAVAALVGVSDYKVRAAFTGGARLPDETRAKIYAAADELGYKPPAPGERIPHWTRSSFREWVYFPAVTGHYPANLGRPQRPVPVKADALQGVPVKGPHTQKRTDACWTVICSDGRPHRNRHSHRTDLEEARIPKVLIDERIGHEDTSVQANYTHITDTMRDQLAELLIDMWFEALDARLAMCPTSSVAVLNGLLHTRAQQVGWGAAARRGDTVTRSCSNPGVQLCGDSCHEGSTVAK
ncbi:hypothetical protein [Nocardia sp. BMG51109]|uniref:hypothetical protein n=1 Tax=Nocardia sp. BMG51109 TaxID=1056816 RepID=UPI0018DD578B|nr:hypothetical protein [Nocardia sp. BMG51109]